MSQQPLVSIIINNYNYGRFLPAAIESALQQTYAPLEIIVVDDGSTDESWEVIARYGERVLPVLKENGGQASAFNAGFARARGEVVLFLDADDVLLPDTCSRVMGAFLGCPEATKVQFRLEVIDEGGRRSGQLLPPPYKAMPAGDLRAQVRCFPDDIPWLPTSGNAFAARVLREIFPVPEPIYRLCADYYLLNLPPLFGPVLSLEEVGGYYRIHGSNHHTVATVNLEQTRQIIVRSYHTHRYIKRFAGALGLVGFPENPAAVPSVTFLAHRITSRKLDPQGHPFPQDRELSLCWRGIMAAFRRFDLPLPLRAVYALWFVAILPAPAPLARWLAVQFFFPERRPRLPAFLRYWKPGGRKAIARRVGERVVQDG